MIINKIPLTSLQQFYAVLFDRNEGVCWTQDVKGTDVSRLDYFCQEPPITKNFFCINPLAILEDKRPTKPWHSKHKGRRADCNVTAYRNILCEFDTGTIEEQRELIWNSGLLYNTIVFSGGKSIHVIISMAEPFKDEAEYRRYVKAIYAKLGKTVDDKCLNPSRLSRAPGAFRDHTLQEMLETPYPFRIEREWLINWLGGEPVAPAAAPRESVAVGYKRVLSPWSNSYLRWGAEQGTRNATLFKVSCEMCRAGYSKHEVFDKVFAVADLPEHEIRNCIDSAFARATIDADAAVDDSELHIANKGI